MFAPERMRRVVVVAAKPRMRTVIETLYAARLLHVEDYVGEDAGFRLGEPFPEGSAIAENLLKVKGLQKALGVEGLPAVAMAPVRDASAELKALEGDIARAVEERGKASEERKELEARTHLLQRFAPLGVKLEQLRGYQSLKVFTGAVQRDPRPDLAKVLAKYDVAFVEEERGFFVGVFVHKDEANAALKALEGAQFTAVEPPAGSGFPDEELRNAVVRLRDLEERVARLDAQLEALRARHGSKLLALGAVLTTESQKATAPVRFRTSSNSFVVEGWVPASRANELARRLEQATNGRVFVQTYEPMTVHADVHGKPPPKGEVPMHERIEAVASPVGEARRDGGQGTEGSLPPRGTSGFRAGGEDSVSAVAQRDGGDAQTAKPHGAAHAGHAKPVEPPVMLKNPGPARSFEMLLGLHSMPKYNEFDPTTLMALFFPLFFGLMVGDLGFGILIILVGAYLKTHKPMGMGGPAVGRMLMLSGLFAALIGTFVFGEALGLHFTSHEEVSWASIFAGVDASAGEHAFEALEEHYQWGFIQLGYYSKLDDVVLLLKLSIAIALLHVNMGFVIGFFNVLRAHGMRHAVTEKLAWVILEVGLALWIMSMFPSAAPLLKPAFGYSGLGLVGLSLVLLVAGHGALAIMELPSLATNTLSYTRLTAVGMSKAGLALVFNMFAFEMMGGSVAGWAIWVLGILFILPLAILAGGLHSLRLHFVEFFTKFYEGGGRRYAPFGRPSEPEPSKSS